MGSSTCLHERIRKKTVSNSGRLSAVHILRHPPRYIRGSQTLAKKFQAPVSKLKGLLHRYGICGAVDARHGIDVPAPVNDPFRNAVLLFATATAAPSDRWPILHPLCTDRTIVDPRRLYQRREPGQGAEQARLRRRSDYHSMGPGGLEAWAAMIADPFTLTGSCT